MVEIKNLEVFDISTLLEKIATRLDKAQYRRETMSPEEAFGDALAEVADAIRDVAREYQGSISRIMPSAR